MTALNLIKELFALSNEQNAKQMASYFKTGKGDYAEGDYFLGIRVPELRNIAQNHSSLPLHEVEVLLSHSIHEVRLTGVFILVYRCAGTSQKVLEETAQFYLQNIDCINNWDLVDSSCYKILGRYLQHRDRSVLYELANSTSLWQRRIAMVSCYHFIKQKDFKDAFFISSLLIEDSEDLIHKAVGWMLREISKKDQAALEEYLSQNKRYLTMPRTMLRSSIETLNPTLRKQYLEGLI